MADTPVSDFGTMLRRYRIAAGLSQRALAARAGVSARGISDLERGINRSARPDTLQLLADALALPPPERAALLAVGGRRVYTPAPAADPPPVASPFPAPLTPLLGRAGAVAAACVLLDRADVRLVTLTGPGGVGKTRLALAVVAAVRAHFPGGVHVVDLAPLTDPSAVMRTIAATLGIREVREQSPIAALAARLGTAPSLLLLDNMEQLLPAAPDLAALLSACPTLTILATSRVALRLRGEHRFPVFPLPTPDLDNLPPLAALRDYPAVALFAERAAAVAPDFALTAANAPAVVAICAHLDGLPLALELAAARTDVLAPAALLARFVEADAPAHPTLRLGVLADGPGDLPARQRTLAATLDWSEALLAPDARTLLARLGIFAGGCSLAALAAVAGDAEPVEGADVPPEPLATVAALVGASLLRVQEGPDGEPRFAMLETIRAYAVGRLAASGEAEAIAARHAAYYLALVERAEAGLHGPEQAVWLARLAADLDNLRAALRHALARGDADTALRLAAAPQRFWETRGSLSEGRQWLAAALALSATAASDAARGKALTVAGLLAMAQGDYPAARPLHEVALALRRASGDRRGAAHTLDILGLLAQYQGDHAAARPLHEASLAAMRALGDARGTANALFNLATALHDGGDYAAAHALHEESLALRRGLGDSRGIALSLHTLGILAQHRGDMATAHALQEEALALRRTLGDTVGVAHTLRSLGQLALLTGDPAAARAYHAEAVALVRPLGGRGLPHLLLSLGTAAFAEGDRATARASFAEALTLVAQGGDWQWIPEGLEGLAAMAAEAGRIARAAQLWAAAAAQRATRSLPLPPDACPDLERRLAAARVRLDPAAWAAAWAVGSTLAADDAVALALAPDDYVLPPPDVSGVAATPPAAASDGPGGKLTAREQEVAGLVACGLTNCQIAEALFIRERTVESHVANLLRKLDVPSRTHVAAWAIAHGLAAPNGS